VSEAFFLFRRSEPFTHAMPVPEELEDSFPGWPISVNIGARITYVSLIAAVRRCGFILGHACRILHLGSIDRARATGTALIREFSSALRRGISDQNEESTDSVLSDDSDDDVSPSELSADE
jgi:hypothetical protein